MRTVLRRPARDDRQRQYTPVVLAQIALRAEGPEVRAAARDLQQTLRRVVTEETRKWSLDRVVAGIGLSITLIVVLAFGTLVIGSVFGGLPGLLIFILSFVAVVSLDRAIARRRISAGVGATIAAHGFCAACGYSLRGLTPAEDGCLLCPECGAAWQAARITRAHWESPRFPLARPPNLLMRLHFLRPPMVPDHRGMLCRRLDSRLLSLPRERRDALGAGAMRSLRIAIRRPTLWLRVLLACLLGIPMLWLLTNTPGRSPDTAAGTFVALWVLWSLGAAILSLVTWSTLAGELGVRTRRVVEACLARSLCPSCTTDLPAAAEDGCRVCPGCGSSWR